MNTLGKHTKGDWKVVEGGSQTPTAGNPDGFSIMGGCGCCGSPYMEPSYSRDGSHEIEQLANAKLVSQCAHMAELVNKVANLNPKAGEIGQGMLLTIIGMAQEIKERL